MGFPNFDFSFFFIFIYFIGIFNFNDFTINRWCDLGNNNIALMRGGFGDWLRSSYWLSKQLGYI